MLFLAGLVTLLLLGDSFVVAVFDLLELPVGKCSLFKEIIEKTKNDTTANNVKGAWYPQRYLSNFNITEVDGILAMCPCFNYEWNIFGACNFRATFGKINKIVKGNGMLDDSLYSVRVKLTQLDPALDIGINQKTLIGEIIDTNSMQSFQIRLFTFYETKDYSIRGICSNDERALGNLMFVFLETAKKSPEHTTMLAAMDKSKALGIEDWNETMQVNCKLTHKNPMAKWMLKS